MSIVAYGTLVNSQASNIRIKIMLCLFVTNLAIKKLKSQGKQMSIVAYGALVKS